MLRSLNSDKLAHSHIQRLVRRATRRGAFPSRCLPWVQHILSRVMREHSVTTSVLLLRVCTHSLGFFFLSLSQINGRFVCDWMNVGSCRGIFFYLFTATPHCWGGPGRSHETGEGTLEANTPSIKHAGGGGGCVRRCHRKALPELRKVTCTLST